jgi:hypothetical protein
MIVGGLFPLAEAWASAGASGATLFAMDAVVEAEFFFDMEGLVLTLFVFVTDHVVGTGHNATRATSAQTSGDDLFVEFFPLGGPAFGFWRCRLGNCHGFQSTLRKGGLR